MGPRTSSDVTGGLLLGNLFSVGLLCIACLHLFEIPHFCLLVGLNKAMETPIPGGSLLRMGWISPVWGCKPLKRPLYKLGLVLWGARPLLPEVRSFCTCVFSFYFGIFVCGLLTFVSPAGEVSTNTLSGWAETLHALYSEIGGCISYKFFLLVLPYFSLVFCPFARS